MCYRDEMAAPQAVRADYSGPFAGTTKRLDDPARDAHQAISRLEAENQVLQAKLQRAESALAKYATAMADRLPL